LHPTGHRLFPEIALIDRGGHHAKSVYDYVFRVAPRKVFCSKGYRGYEQNFIRRSQGANQRLFIIKVDSPKEAIHARLRQSEPGPGYIHLPSNPSAGVDLSYCNQLCSERMVIGYRHGRREPYFEKISDKARNESFDALVLNFGARQLVEMTTPVDIEATRAWLSSPASETVPASRPQPKLSLSNEDFEQRWERAKKASGWIHEIK